MTGLPTESGDYIVVDTPDFSLDALGGDDTVIVVESGVVARGGEGDDWLSTNLNVIAGPGEDTDGDDVPDSANVEEITAELRGDGGDDHIHASLRGVNYDLFNLDITARLVGGEGNDQIWLDASGTGGVITVSIDGGRGDDDIRVTSLGDGLGLGANGPITVDAGGGNDTVRIFADGPGGTDISANVVTARAGGGNDFVESYSSSSGYSSGQGENHLYGGTGNDTLTGTAEAGGDVGSAINEAEGGAGNDSITLTAFAPVSSYGTVENTARGDDGHDRIDLIGEISEASDPRPGAGTNTATGGAGDDIITARLTFHEEAISALNDLSGGAGDDRLTASIRLVGDAFSSDAHSELSGGDGDDRLTVSGGEGNILNGGKGDDTLNGGGGSDTLIGLQGDDLLRGRGGEDTFLFGYIRDGERDRISDFVIGEDVIDLSQIDANRDRGGEQSFRFGTREGTGRVWLEEDGNRTVVHADDGHRVLEVAILDGNRVDSDDYSASDFLL